MDSVKKRCMKGFGLSIPKRKLVTEQKEGKLMKIFKTEKEQHLHSVTSSSDCDTFVAADESRINMYNIEYKDRPIYNLIDYERKNTTFDDERITSTVFNPHNPSLFLYTTSNGKINICDLRERSDFHQRATLTFETSGKSAKLSSNVFSKWLNCVSSAKFSHNPTQLFSRDYLSVKMWDLRAAQSNTAASIVNMHTKPVYSAQVTDYMERNLGVLLDNDSLEDQFFLDVSPDGKYMATGAYNKSGHVLDINATTNTVINTVFGSDRNSQAGKLKVYGKAKRLVNSNTAGGLELKVDLKKRVNMGCWAPQKDIHQGKQTLALVFRNCIYLYHNNNQKQTSSRTRNVLGTTTINNQRKRV